MMTLSLEEKLEEALKGTFPASDPFSLAPGVRHLSSREQGSEAHAVAPNRQPRYAWPVTSR
jgi:hypothetical protein